MRSAVGVGERIGNPAAGILIESPEFEKGGKTQKAQFGSEAIVPNVS